MHFKAWTDNKMFTFGSIKVTDSKCSGQHLSRPMQWKQLLHLWPYSKTRAHPARDYNRGQEIDHLSTVERKQVKEVTDVFNDFFLHLTVVLARKRRMLGQIDWVVVGISNYLLCHAIKMRGMLLLKSRVLFPQEFSLHRNRPACQNKCSKRK